MSRYHKLTSWDDAKRIISELSTYVKREVITIPTGKALGYTTAEEIFARRSIPHFIASAVDGYAIKSSDTYMAHTSNPIKLSFAEISYVNTGDPVEFPRFDAVIMWEDVVVEDDGIVLRRSVKPGEGLRLIGEDAIKGELIIPRRTFLTPEHLALARAAGVREIKVFQKTRIAIIPTGEEMKPPESELQTGELPETSSEMVAQHIRQLGGEVVWVSQPVPNDLELLNSALKHGLKVADVVFFIGGSSRGKHDLVSKVIEQQGKLLVHGIRIRPSKPTIIGLVNQKPVIGLPGFPAATYYILTNLIPQLINPFSPKDIPDRRTTSVILTTAVPSRGGTAEMVRMAVGLAKDKRLHAVPLPRGSSRLNSLAQSNAHLFIPESSEGYRKGTEVNVTLIKRHIPMLMMASDDIALRLLISMLRDKDIYIILAKKGSLGAINAWNSGGVYLAGAHMLDPETEQYNTPYIKQDAILLTLAKRQQGFFLRPGTPRITSFRELVNRGFRLVNREKGAGTRMLLDYLLAKQGIDPRDIKGYFFEQFSHMSVALAVKIGLGEVGFGIKAAADALGLDFVPVHSETYHIILPPSESHLAEVMASILKSEQWRHIIKQWGGYDTDESGEVNFHHAR